MKTFKQWYDNLSEPAQRYVNSECRHWIDLTTDDYYKYVPLTKEILDYHLKQLKDFPDNRTTFVETLPAALAALYEASTKAGKPDVDLKLVLNKMLASQSHLRKHLPSEIQRELRKEEIKTYGTVHLEDILFTTDDFDKLNFSKLSRGHIPTITPATIEIFGYEFCRNYLKNKAPGDARMSSTDQTIFDDLFFGEDGWTEQERLDLIRNRYKDGLDGVERFIHDLVAVDRSYLKYIPLLFTNGKAHIAAEVYKLKKPAEELTDNMTIEQKYRYPKDIRKLFQIAACCVRKNLGKAMTGTIGDNASLIRFLNFDFRMVFESLYPEYATKPEPTEEEPQVL